MTPVEKAYQAAYYVAHRDKIKARARAWQKANPERRNAWRAEWRKANPEKTKTHQAKYSAANREKLDAKNRTWRKANPEKYKAQAAAWRRVNQTKVKASAAKYRAAHPDVAKMHIHKRRTRKAGNGGSFTAAQWRAKLALHGGQCFYCPAPATAIDHDVPIARGGHSGIGNLLPACKSCNSHKGAKTAVEYLSMR